MDYEMRYKKALERASEYHFDGVKQCISDTLEYIFPELKENKAEWIEKIRQELKSYLEHREVKQVPESDAINQWIAWLEQQCDINKNTYEIVEKEKKDFVSPKEEEANAPSEYGKYVDECLYDASKHFFSEGEDKYSVADLFYAGVRCGKNWIEKQKENLSENPCEDCINDKGCINCENGSMKETEKNSDNNEPSKFKVGDIIKHNKANIIYKVISVNNGSYYIKNIMSNGEIKLFNAEQNFHVLTIDDAIVWIENQCEKEQKFKKFNVVQIPDGYHAYIKDRKVYIEEYRL